MHLYSTLDWDAKQLIAKSAHWGSSNPCDYCTVQRTNLGGKQFSVCDTSFKKKQPNKSSFSLQQQNRPVCLLLEYCNPILAFPFEPMHALFVGGVIPSIIEAFFEMKIMSQEVFFVRSLF